MMSKPVDEPWEDDEPTRASLPKVPQMRRRKPSFTTTSAFPLVQGDALPFRPSESPSPPPPEPPLPKPLTTTPPATPSNLKAPSLPRASAPPRRRMPSRSPSPPPPPPRHPSPPPPPPRRPSPTPHPSWGPPPPVRPPNPIAETRRHESAPPAPLPPELESEAPQPEPEASDEARPCELLWSGDDEAALDRARTWDLDQAGGLLPRRGARAVLPRDGGTWLAHARVATHADLCAATAPATEPAARVVEGTLTYDLSPHEELAATRAALRRLAIHDKGIRESMDGSEGLADDPLTPVRMLRLTTDELIDKAAAAGMSKEEMRRTTRETLIRKRKYSELHILGGDHIVARLRLEGVDAPWVVYLPKEATSALPLMVELPVRAAVTIHTRQDPEESEPHGLRVLALARLEPRSEAT